MSNNSTEQVVNQIRLLIESFPSSVVTMEVNDKPDVNVENGDYYVEKEVKLIPKNPASLGITIWLCADSIGFFVDEFEKAAKIAKLSISNQKKGLTCAGTEPVQFISPERLLDVCNLVSSGRLDISIGILAGALSGAYADIFQGTDASLYSSIGMPKKWIEMASMVSMGEVKSLQYEAW